MVLSKIEEKNFKNEVLAKKRILTSCSMCKKNKIKCDKEMPQCKSCFKRGIPCLSVCQSTKREVPRSYLLYLEDLLFVYYEKLYELGVDFSTLKSNFPTAPDDPPVNVDIYRERFTESNELFNNDNRYIKRPSHNACDLKSFLDSNQHNLKRKFSDVDFQNSKMHFADSEIELDKKAKESSMASSSKAQNVDITPSNSSISKSNILESFNSTASMNKSDSISHNSIQKVLAQKATTADFFSSTSKASYGFSSLRKQNDMIKENESHEFKTYLGDSSGIPFAKLMLTAINFKNDTETTDLDDEVLITNLSSASKKDDTLHHIEIPIVDDNVDSLYLPSFNEAENLVKAYFNRTNPQYPIIEFCMFNDLYFQPLYGDKHVSTNHHHSKTQRHNTAKAKNNEANLPKTDFKKNKNLNNSALPADDMYKEVSIDLIPECFRLCLNNDYVNFIELLKQEYFETEVYDLISDPIYDNNVVPLNLLFIAFLKSGKDTSIFEQQLELPLVYKKALFFTNLVMALGSCSEVLLNGTLHCITLKKRAMKWVEFVLNDTNAAAYECDDKNGDAFVSNSPILQQIRLQFIKLESLSALLLVSAFAMFIPSTPTVWYSLGIPLRLVIDLGLHNEKYNNELLLAVSTNLNGHQVACLKNNSDFLIDLRRRLFWTTYSMDRQLALYFGRPVSLPDESISLNMISYKPPNSLIEDLFSVHTRIISIAMMEIRKLQSELLSVMYAPKSQLPREFEHINLWRKDFDKKLNKWYDEKVPKNLNKIGHIQFKREFFRLNLQHTKTMLNGISPRRGTPHTEQEIDKLHESTKNMIYQYHRLWLSKSLNFTWIACHNLFMCSMTFLYTCYKKNVIESLDSTCDTVLTVIKAFGGTCEAAPNCHKSIKVLSRAVKKLIIKTQRKLEKASIESPESVTLSTSESLDTDPELQLFFKKLLYNSEQNGNKNLTINTVNNVNCGNEWKADESEEIESIWGLDSEYRSGTSNIYSTRSNLNINMEDEEQVIYDLLYSQSNNANTADWPGYMLSPKAGEPQENFR